MRIHDLRREHTKTEREAQQEQCCRNVIRWNKQKKRHPGSNQELVIEKKEKVISEHGDIRACIV